MNNDTRRITLVTRGLKAPEREWDMSADAEQRIIFVPSMTVLQYALATGVAAMEQDIGRVILDHAASAAQYLQVLAALPAELAGDVAFISDHGAFISSMGRGGDRVLHALDPADVDFYLEVNGLTRAASHQQVA